MTEIERKALALVNEVVGSGSWTMTKLSHPYNRVLFQALCRAIEQHEAFKQEVSDAVEEWHGRWVGAGESHSYFMSLFSRFILPKPVDPLVEALQAVDEFASPTWVERIAPQLRAALAARGLKIVEDKP